MNTTVQLLTGPAAGAIATLQLVGPNAWPVLQSVATTWGGRPLPEQPTLFKTHLIRLFGDEIVLAIKQVEPVCVLELHSHGGIQIVQRIRSEFLQRGITESQDAVPTQFDHRAFEPLIQAKTFRVANILLDQYQGAFQQEIRRICQNLSSDGLHSLQQLAAFAPLGARMVTGWKLVIAGAPNAGKSSLLNRLAGYDRAVVSPIAGTTRDVVTTTLALDGWPIELADTAGIRETEETVEAEGIRRARAKLQEADLVVWLLDATEAEPVWPTPLDRESAQCPWLIVWNKWDEHRPEQVLDSNLKLSAKTGDGIAGLVATILQTWIPQSPKPGQPIPYSPELARLTRVALDLLRAGNVVEAEAMLTSLATGSELHA